MLLQTTLLFKRSVDFAINAKPSQEIQLLVKGPAISQQ